MTEDTLSLNVEGRLLQSAQSADAMVVLPGGTYWMGSDLHYPEGRAGEAGPLGRLPPRPDACNQ